MLERAVILADGGRIDESMLGFLPPSGKEEVKPSVSPGATGLEDRERQMIEAALAQAGGNKSKAADILKITRRVLYTKLKKYGMI